MNVINQLESMRHRQINVLEWLRELLLTLEQAGQLSPSLHERVLETRLQTDREIEALRG
jgi:hypothetical protein